MLPDKRAILLFLALAGVAIQGHPANGSKSPGERILISESTALFAIDPSGSSRQKIADKVDAVALSRDANLVAYADHHGVYVFSFTDNRTLTLTQLAEGRVNNLAWSPDQKFVAYDLGVPMKSVDLFIASYPPNGEPPRDLGPWYETLSISPDAKFIVHPTLEVSNRARSNLEAVNVQTGKREMIYQAVDVIWRATYSPDGSSIAFLMTHPGTPAPASDDEPECGGPDLDLWLLPLDSKKPQHIMAKVYNFEWSPDSRFLAIETGSEECDYPPDDAAVFISSADGKDQFQISKNAPSVGPIFSPDSKRVAFAESNAYQLVIGDISTRALIPLLKAEPRGFPPAACDWK